MRIQLYHWGLQCPHNLSAVDMVKELREEGHEVEKYDVAGNRELASSVNMFSPNLTVFNGDLRWHGPLTGEFREAVSRGEIPRQDPYLVQISQRIVRETVIPLTDRVVTGSREVCGVSSDLPFFAKAGWVREIMDRYRLPHLGYLHYRDEKCLGGAEFVPSLEVPYRIPRGGDTAFVTCSFPSEGDADYKSFPLEKLEEALPGLGYSTLLIISSEEVVFPNGPLEWFLERGYRDKGVIHEEPGYARMHLLEKKL